ncbi:MAG: M23 family metallopeptidase [Firmicutes bacterium]|nr:M23 family metallopeptidase [Bacillota bacterium]
MERKKEKGGSGFYIAICCCLVIIAIVGYANRMSDRPEPERSVAEEKTDIERAEPIVSAMPTNKPEKNAEAKTESKNTKTAEKKNTPVNKTANTEEKMQFAAPVKGKVIGEYSGDDLVYNEVLRDWRAHSGLDFEAKDGEQVLCSANGVVEDVFDSGLGKCVVIDHKNGFRTMYANLDDEVAVKVGDELSQGDVIGTVGDTALGDMANEPHLHFEMSENKKPVNPIDYLN